MRQLMRNMRGIMLHSSTERTSVPPPAARSVTRESHYRQSTGKAQTHRVVQTTACVKTTIGPPALDHVKRNPVRPVRATIGQNPTRKAVALTEESARSVRSRHGFHEVMRKIAVCSSEWTPIMSGGRHLPEVLAQKFDAHTSTVDDFPKGDPLRAVLLVPQMEAIAVGLQRDDAIQPELTFADLGTHTSQPRALVAVVADILCPLLGALNSFGPSYEAPAYHHDRKRFP